MRQYKSAELRRKRTIFLRALPPPSRDPAVKTPSHGSRRKKQFVQMLYRAEGDGFVGVDSNAFSDAFQTPTHNKKMCERLVSVMFSRLTFFMHTVGAPSGKKNIGSHRCSAAAAFRGATGWRRSLNGTSAHQLPPSTPALHLHCSLRGQSRGAGTFLTQREP